MTLFASYTYGENPTFYPPPTSCASARWTVDSWAQLTVNNNCGAEVKVKATLQDPERSRLYAICKKNKRICKSSYPKSYAKYDFRYCIEYTDYELGKHYGRCR